MEFFVTASVLTLTVKGGYAHAYLWLRFFVSTSWRVVSVYKHLPGSLPQTSRFIHMKRFAQTACGLHHHTCYHASKKKDNSMTLRAISNDPVVHLVSMGTSCSGVTPAHCLES
jgi:hypothetical protein